MTKIKICGITRLEDAQKAIELGADALGFNFYRQSPRYISPRDAQEITAALTKKVWIAGVFVNSAPREIEEIAQRVPLDTIQLHGDESPERCSLCSGRRVIKALNIKPDFKSTTLEDYLPHVDYLLVDGFVAGERGGNGVQIEHVDLSKLSETGHFDRMFLAGGLTPTNVAALTAEFHPFGVDVASGVESEPGIKDEELMRAFIAAVRSI